MSNNNRREHLSTFAKSRDEGPLELEGMSGSVVPVGHLRSRSPTANCGKVVKSRQRLNVRDFVSVQRGGGPGILHRR
jgi:hypothetical protein